MASEAYARLWGKNGDGEIDALISHLPALLGRSTDSSASQKGFIAVGESRNISKHHATLDWNEEKGRFELLCCSKNGMTVNGVQFSNGDVAGLKSHSAIRLGDVCVYFLLPTDVHPRSDQNQTKRESESAPTKVKADESGSEEDAEEMSAQSNSKLHEGDSVQMKLEGDTDSQNAGLAQSADASQRSTTPSKQLTYPEMIARAFESTELQEKAMTEGLLAKEVVQWVLVEYFESDTSRRQKVQNAVSNYLCKTYEKIASHPSQTRNVRWRKPDGTLRSSSLLPAHSYAQLRSVDDVDAEPRPKKAKKATFSSGDVTNQYEPLPESNAMSGDDAHTTAFWTKLVDHLPLSAREMMPKIAPMVHMEASAEQTVTH